MIESIQEVVNTYQQNEFGKLELITELWTIILYDRNFSSGQFEQTMKEIELNYPEVYSNLIDEYDQKPLKNITEGITEDDYQSELVQLKNNFSLERIENLKRLGKKVYPITIVESQKNQKVVKAKKQKINKMAVFGATALITIIIVLVLLLVL